MTKKALSRAGLEPAPLGEKDIPSELPFILIMTKKSSEETSFFFQMPFGTRHSGVLLRKSLKIGSHLSREVSPRSKA